MWGRTRLSSGVPCRHFVLICCCRVGLLQKNLVSVLIVSRPGPIADGLQAIVASMPGASGTYHAPDAPQALKALAQLRPQLVILDFGLPNRQAATLLHMMRADCPGTRCIVLAGTVAERTAAEEAGADATVLEGCPALNLIATLERLLARGQAYPQS